MTAGVGAVTTIAGGIAAYGSIERYTTLARSYSAMAAAITSLLGRHDAKLLTDAQLIEESETLLTAEYAAWSQQMLPPSGGARQPEAMPPILPPAPPAARPPEGAEITTTDQYQR